MGERKTNFEIMKNKGAIVFLLITLFALSVYYLARTWKINQIRKDASNYAMVDNNVDPEKKQYYLDSLWKQKVFLGSTVESLTKQELGLGLDLQGGMHVILEVSPGDIIASMTKGSRDPNIKKAIETTKELAARGSINFLDEFVKQYKSLSPNAKLAPLFATAANRDEVNPNSTDNQVMKYVQTEIDGAYDRSFKVIQTRVDKFGVANANIHKLPGTNRIQVELPGIDNPQRVRNLLSGSAKLEFCEVYDLSEIGQNMDNLAGLLQRIDQENLSTPVATEETVAEADSTGEESSLAAALSAKTEGTDTPEVSQGALSNIFVPTPYGTLGVRTKDTTRLNAVLKRSDARALFPADLTFLYDVSPFNEVGATEDIVEIYAVKNFGNAPLEGDVITNARQDFNPMSGKPEVSMQMNTLGARKWKELTGKNVGRRVAIILDNYVYSAPNVNQEISGGNSSISGNFTVEQAQDLANVLKAGKLPAPTTIVEEAVVGASVGSEAFRAGLISGILGVIAVIIFMMLYYSTAGWIANLAVIVNLILLLGIMASFGATMTLAGIAGMVLSVGMSVDANVLIYERIKEELNEGKSFAAAIPLGFKHAMPSILDSQLTSALTGVVLFIFGTGFIKGFATTLLIGIATSLFCAIFVSRLVFDRYVAKGRSVNFHTKWTDKLFNNKKFNFVKNRNRFYKFSAVFMTIAILSMIFRGFSLGVDFKGGRTFDVKFEQWVNTDEVRVAVEHVFPGAAAEVKTFDGFDKVRITSAYRIDDTGTEVDDELRTALAAVVADVNGNKGEIIATSKVGANIAQDMIWNSLKAVLYAIILMYLYVFVRFKKSAYGEGAILALIHDAVVVIGVFSLLHGILPFSLDIDEAFMGAILTLIGFSINDTVVIYDRIREYTNTRRASLDTMDTIINDALNSTLSRTAVTSVAVLIVLIGMLIFGGESIRGFIFAMFIGVIVGTYSSLFIAAPYVVDALKRGQRKESSNLKPATTVTK